MDEIIEKMISMVDYDEFKKVIEVTIDSKKSKAKINDDILHMWLEKWALAKKDLFIRFGERLILQKRVKMNMTEQEAADDITELQQQFPKYAAILEYITPYDFSTGKLGKNVMQTWLHNMWPDIFKTGASTSRALSKLVQDAAFDIEVSKAIQNRESEGWHIISIHPMDFATLSTSKHDWNTCMDLVAGFNKSGVYALMMDPYTTIAYADKGRMVEYVAQNDKEAKFKWNNKMWRYLVYLLDDRIIFGHRIGSPPRGIEHDIIEMAGMKVELSGQHSSIRQAGSHYYNTENYMEYVTEEGKKAGRTTIDIGVKSLPCLVCGKEMRNIESYHGYVIHHSCE